MVFAEFYVDWADTCNYVLLYLNLRLKKFGLIFHVSIQLKD